MRPIHTTILSLAGATLLVAGLTPVFLPAQAADAPPTTSISTKQSSKLTPTALHLTLDQGKPIDMDGAATSVFVANPEIADVQVLSPTTLMVFGKKMGQTTLMATDADGKTLVHKRLVVEQNLGDLRTTLRAMIPGNSIQVKAVPDGILMTGSAKDATIVEDARRLAARFVAKDGEVINRVRIEGNNQIHIRVRFAEVGRDSDKRLGVNWESLGVFGSGYGIGFALGNSLIPTKPGTSVPYYPQGDVGSSVLGRVRPTVGGNVSNVLSLNKGGFNAAIDTLIEEGLVTILAEPNLTAMSGQTASFLAGGEFPVPIPQSNSTLSVEFKPYGVSLAFTPTLVGKSRINLHVRPEVSQLTEAGAVTLNGITIQALTTRRAETTIELNSGESFVIGGLLNNNQSQSVQKYPFLGDLPILGTLFRSTRFQNSQSELVIIITPYIVKPTTEEMASLPTDGFSAPSDFDQMIRGRSTNSDPEARTMSGTSRAVIVDEAGNELPSSPVAAARLPVETMTAPQANAPLAIPVSSQVQPQLAQAEEPQPSPVAPAAPEPTALPIKAALQPETQTPRRADPFAGRAGGFIME